MAECEVVCYGQARLELDPVSARKARLAGPARGKPSLGSLSGTIVVQLTVQALTMERLTRHITWP